MSGTPAVEARLADRRGPRAGGPLALAYSAAPTIFLLVGLVLLASMVYVALGMRIETPWIMVDELIYSELGKGIADHGRLLLRDEPTSYFSFLYPLTIAPAWLASSMETTYAVAKAINAVLMSLTAVPVYLWARRLMTPTFAVATAVLTLLMPPLLYSGMLMTENAFLPAFVLAAFAIALTLERPTPLRQALALGTIGLALSVRMQGLALVPILLTAIMVDGLLDGRDRSERGIVASLVARVRAFRYSLLFIGLAAGGYWIFKSVQEEPLTTGLGAYQIVGVADYEVSEIARWSLYHAGELCLAVGLVPVSAFLVLLGTAAWRGTRDARERAFLAVTASAIAWFLLVVATFASRFVHRIEERNLFYLTPLFLLALGLWLSRGAPRPLLAALPAAVAPAVLLFFLPIERFLQGIFVSDTFALLPLHRLAADADGGAAAIESRVVVGAFLVALVFLVLPRVLALTMIPVAVAALFVYTSYVVSDVTRDYAKSLHEITYQGEGDWIDEAIGADADAVYLFGGGIDADDEFSRLWQTEFWNRSVGTVYRVGDAAYSGFHEVDASVDGSTGLILTEPGRRPIRTTYAVAAARGFELAGKVVAENSRTVLFRVPGRVALAATTTGVYGDGWTGPGASYSRFATPGGRPGRVRVVISREAWTGPDAPGRVRIRVGPSSGPGIERVTAERRWVVHSRKYRIFMLPTPRPPFRVDVQIDPTFSPSTFGRADTRQLGAQVLFAFLPGSKS